MNREALEALAQRCEQATEPDYEIDAAIADAICKGSWYAPDNPAWKFTASVDAALTLVPERMTEYAKGEIVREAVRHCIRCGDNLSELARHLTAAALRAILASRVAA